MASPKGSSKTTLDHLIARSKQVTADLMVVRHDLERPRPTTPNSYRRNPGIERMSLVMEECRDIANILHEIWMMYSFGKDEDYPDFPRPKPRRLTSGTLELTVGER